MKSSKEFEGNVLSDSKLRAVQGGVLIRTTWVRQSTTGSDNVDEQTCVTNY